MDAGLEGVVIGPREMYEKLIEVAGDVREIKTELGGSSGLVARVNDQENRLRAVERRVWAAAGAAGLFSGSLAVIIDALIRLRA